MDKRSLLLRIKLCPGIGLKGENLAYQWLQNEDISKLDIEEVQAMIINLLRDQHLNYQKFAVSFLSREINIMVTNTMRRQWITIFDDVYPQQLKEMYLPPIILFYAGNLALLREANLLGVVGSRKCSKYAVQAMKKIFSQTVISHYVIVSGLAEGVDTLGHQIALANHGKTIAVLGTGLDCFYPRSNQTIQLDLMKNNLVLSEYNYGVGPRKHHFVERNRIIAGLSQKLLVVEARLKSGSLITASLALQNNRDILAVPGNVNSHYSAGSNELIAAGCQPCLDERDVLGRIVI
ncbi:DNA-processing protein DprA [Fructilactobacillus frigidiflavus]|uniref:DNA-processing protein DprA n=1 Tax=Fructilactobacillus frigidiflavus TaxID=3242688 RepID=UPI003756AE06